MGTQLCSILRHLIFTSRKLLPIIVTSDFLNTKMMCTVIATKSVIIFYEFERYASFNNK